MGQPAILALADGTLFEGTSIGIAGQAVGEIVFNTALTGYQEILTDPSYTRQIVTLTYPHIGNVGCNQQDNESNQVYAAGLVIRNLPLLASNWRMEMTFPEFLAEHRVVAIAEIDTRKLTRILREGGAQGACLMAGEVNSETAIEQARRFGGLEGVDLAKVVTTQKSYQWTDPVVSLTDGKAPSPAKRSDHPIHVVCMDFGVKHMMLRLLAARGCTLTVVPATTTAAEIMALKPTGVLLSNGPGDPAACDYAIQTIQDLLKEDVPLFGICLGCQLLALACGAKTKKMKYGHHGANHPIQDLRSQRVTITSQNHGFCIDEVVPDQFSVTHRSLFDGTIQGIALKNKPVMGFQGHPEASPGPHDLHEIFDEFVDVMKEYAKTN